MRFLKDKKGQVRVIEAFFASMLLFSALSLIPPQQIVARNPNEPLSATALNILTSLDADGHLTYLIENRDWTNFRRSIQSLLPVTVWFNLTVFNENMVPVNDVSICSGSAVGQKISSVDYVCASTNSDYSIHIIRLQLAMVT
jgi:hypothetical protein